MKSYGVFSEEKINRLIKHVWKWLILALVCFRLKFVWWIENRFTTNKNVGSHLCMRLFALSPRARFAKIPTNLFFYVFHPTIDMFPMSMTKTSCVHEINWMNALLCSVIYSCVVFQFKIQTNANESWSRNWLMEQLHYSVMQRLILNYNSIHSLSLALILDCIAFSFFLCSELLLLLVLCFFFCFCLKICNRR